MSKAKAAFEPIDALDPLKNLSTALREVIPNACVFRGMFIIHIMYVIYTDLYFKSK